MAMLLLTAACSASTEILAGPLTNPANGHEYYLLTPDSWPAAEAEAENLGGTLAVINDAEEQKWVFDKFGRQGNQERSLWIGLHRRGADGEFAWVDGSKVDYANWHFGQPDNAGGNETCVHIWADGKLSGFWNDAAENTTLCAVVEVPGMIGGKALTHREKALVGNWYESGKPNRQAWIAGTGNKLFLVTHDLHAARLIFTREGFIYNTDRLQGEVVKKKILWSNGTWWSCDPAGYETDDKAATKPNVVAGPVTNSNNGHEYFLLTPNTWTASERKAEELGGTLAIIANAAEQEWVFSQFGNYAGTNRSLWIGRWRSWPGAPFTSVTDDEVAFYNWDAGQPDNAGGREFYVQLLPSGKWNDNTDTANPVSGVVEVPGKSDEKALTKKEKSLIGTWYNNGDPEQPCCIAGTEKLLFAIDQNRSASRIIVTPEGFLFSPQWKQHMVLQNDKMLWSRGNWWSREPVKFKMSAKESADR